MPLVEFRDVVYEIAGKRILSGVSFSVDKGETLVLLGRSGSGKSTALKLTNAMLAPTSGQVLVDGKLTTDWNPIALRRRIGYVIQEVGLFPHFTVAQNVGLVPRLEGRAAIDIARRVNEVMNSVGMPLDEFGARYPRELSGGQRQRIGVARALAADPPLLLFDEPFGALDPITRFELQKQFLGWQAQLHKTAIFVTHDVSEALRLGTRIALLVDGYMEQPVSPQEFARAESSEARAFRASLGA